MSPSSCSSRCGSTGRRPALPHHCAALRVFIQRSTGIEESLDFKIESRNPLHPQLQAARRIQDLRAGRGRKGRPGSPAGAWKLEPSEEYDLLRRFEPLLDGAVLEEKTRDAPHFEISQSLFRQWVEADRQSLETNSEPGFMDIFLYMEELASSLKARTASHTWSC